ncbi:hypothetical protein GINT2_000604 [Glugoides intestinalis]
MSSNDTSIYAQFQESINGNFISTGMHYLRLPEIKAFLFQNIEFISFEKVLYYNRAISDDIRAYLPIIFMCVIIYLSIIHPIFFTGNILETETRTSTILRTFSMLLGIIILHFAPFALLSCVFGKIPSDHKQPFLSFFLLLGMLFNTLIFTYFNSIYDFNSGVAFEKSNILLLSIVLHGLQLIDKFYLSGTSFDLLHLGKEVIVCFISIGTNYLLFMFFFYLLIKFIDALSIEYANHYDDRKPSQDNQIFSPVLQQFKSPSECQYKTFTLLGNHKGIIVGMGFYWLFEVLRGFIGI